MHIFKPFLFNYNFVFPSNFDTPYLFNYLIIEVEIVMSDEDATKHGKSMW